MTDWTVMLWALLGGGIASSLTVVRAWSRHPATSTEHAGKADGAEAEADAIPQSATWKFSDSWASNLTGLMTALAALMSTFGDDLPSVGKAQAARFAVTGAVLVTITALAPLVYVALGETSSNIRAPLAAASVTLFGTFGMLSATAWIICYRASATGEHFVPRGTPWLLAAPAIAAVIVVLYALRTLEDVLAWFARTDRSGADPKMAGRISRTCCSGETPQLKFNLL